MTLPEIKHAIRHRLHRLGWTQADLATELATSQQHISRMLSERHAPHMAHLLETLDVLGMELVVRVKR